MKHKLPSVPGGWREDSISVGTCAVRLMRPNDPDKILDDPATLEENARTDYMPYWCWLWPAAIEMAGLVHRIPLEQGKPILEVGAGLGLVGIAGLYAGLDVVMSDYRDEAVHVAAVNAGLNGFQPTIERIDWREPGVRQYEQVLACDVLYESENHQPILKFADAILSAHGTAWIGDPGRQRATEFLETAQATFDVGLFDRELSPIQELKLNEFNLIQLTRQ